jgi:hypothetical protein
VTREWDEVQERLFLELIKEGRPTVAIAGIMRRTKNALIGKAHRLSLTWPEFKEAWEIHSKNALVPPKKFDPAPAPPPPKLRKRFIHPPFEQEPELKFSPPPPEGVRIKDLTPLSCRYMTGTDLYCGKKIHKQSYCEHHYNATRIVKAI